MQKACSTLSWFAMSCMWTHRVIWFPSVLANIITFLFQRLLAIYVIWLYVKVDTMYYHDIEVSVQHFFPSRIFFCCCWCCSHCGFYDEWKANCAVKKMILKQGLYRIDVIFFVLLYLPGIKIMGMWIQRRNYGLSFFFSLLFLYHSDWYSCNLLIFGEE